jgi:hypothetical protein
MADGDVINNHMKEFLRGSSATSKSSRKKATEIVNAVLAAVNPNANKPRVKLAVLALLENYTAMVASGMPSAIQTADDVSGFWLSLSNINANADTDFSCGLNESRSVAVAETIATAPTPSAGPSPESRVWATPPSKSDCRDLLMAAIKLHNASVINDTAFIDMVKTIAQEQVIN